MNRRKKELLRKERVAQYRQSKLLEDALASIPASERPITAHHEAAHAVVAELLDFPVEYVTCVPRIAPAEHEESLRAARSGMVAVSLGGCQMALTGGAVHLPYPARRFFYTLQGLASIPTELKLKIPPQKVLRSCAHDITRSTQLYEPTLSDEEKESVTTRSVILAAGIVNNPDIWSSIQGVAGLLEREDRIDGEQVRRIVRDGIDSRLFISEEKQRELSAASVPYVINLFCQEEDACAAA